MTLFDAYLQGADGLQAFFASRPEDVFNRPALPAKWEPDLVEAINAYQVNLGNSTRLEGDEYVVVTGQQPAIFTGPLYTVYKAITAIKLAEAIEERHGVRCQPLFWVASEDHDFEEARSTHVLRKDASPLTITYSPKADILGRPMHAVPLEQSLHSFVDTIAEETRGGEFRRELRAYLHASLSGSDSLADWSARLLARLFRDSELLLFAPHLLAARRLSTPIFERELRDPLATTQLLNDAGRALETLGYAPQLVKADDECAFFVLVDGRRCKVTYDGTRFHLPEIERAYTSDELAALLHDRPEAFSQNAALRCVVQQHLFPALAYIGGPGEIAYWAQLRGVFERHQQPMPVVYPRTRMRLTTTKLQKLLVKFPFGISELPQGPDALLDAALVAATGSTGRAQIAAQRPEVQRTLQTLANVLRPEDNTARHMLERLTERVDQELDKVERALLHSDQVQVDAIHGQIRRLCDTLAPYRKEQERVYTIWSYLFEHGWGLLDRLTEAVDITSTDIHEVEL